MAELVVFRVEADQAVRGEAGFSDLLVAVFLQIQFSGHFSIFADQVSGETNLTKESSCRSIIARSTSVI